MVNPSAPPLVRARDLAQGWTLLGFWAVPVGMLVTVSVVGPLLHLSFAEFGSLLTLGTAWFGVSCLTNALRCGRAHCWIDGTALPALAVVGGLNLLTGVGLRWTTYLSVLWFIVVVSLVVECCTGTYIGSKKS